MTRPTLSVIVPTYGRWQHIGPLLDTVLSQSFDDWECVICEDGSPSEAMVREVVDRYAPRAAGRLRYYANHETLGYDGNFRRLVELARGRFVFVMGDDDFVAPGAFAAAARTIAKYPNLGVILRVFATFVGAPDRLLQVSRYYPHECRFDAGPRAIVACFRRLVVMSGLVLHRDLAQAAATDRWDGTLFYQHWLAANILMEKDAVYVPDIMAYYRLGGTPVFGKAKAEQDRFTPGVHPPNTDLRMVEGMMAIARGIDTALNVHVADAIERDFANYMYSTLAHQAHVSRKEFRQFYHDLGALGFDEYWSFHAWYWAISALGASNVDRGIRFLRRVLGSTPNLSASTRPS